jgi:hypothetical protein
MSVKTNPNLRKLPAGTLAEMRRAKNLRRLLSANLRSQGFNRAEVDLFLAATDKPVTMPFVLDIIHERLAWRRLLAEMDDSETVF